MILDIYKDSLEFSIQDGKSLLKLGVIYFFSFLVLPVFLALGYSFRVTKVAVNGMINGGESLPDFNDAIAMFVDGLKVFIVKFIYALIPTIILLVFTWIGSLVGGFVASILSTIGLILFIVLAVMACILSNLAIAHMAAGDESLSSAFAIKDLFEIADSIGWLRLIGFYIGLIVIMAVIIFVVALVIGIVFGIFGVSVGFLGAAGAMAGIFSIMMVLEVVILAFIVGPFVSIFEARCIGLIYNLQ